MAVYGLVNIMVSLNKCSFTKKSIQNGSIGQEGVTTTEVNHISQMCQDNAHHSLLILNRLLANYDSWSENIRYKSHLLQSLFTLVSNNTPLIKVIGIFLTNKLKAFTIIDERANQRYFNLEKCCLLPPFAQQPKLSEPLGILFDVAILCFKYGFESIKNDSLHEAFSVLVDLKWLCKQIVKTYLDKDVNLLFDIYNKQLNKVSKCQDFSLHLRQLQNGFFDSIIEYLILSHSHNDIIIILKKQAETTKMIKNQLEKQAREERNRLTATKRKLNFDAESTKKASTLRESKRLKTSVKSCDKENAPPSTQNNAHLNNRAPLANITHVKNVESNTGIQVQPSTSYLGEESDKLPEITTTNTELEYVPIISYKSLLKMIQFCFSSREQMPDKQPYADSSKTVSLIVDGQFTDYALKVAEKKLKALSQPEDTRTWYDPELMDQSEILNFMSELWFSFTLRINGINATHLSKKFKTSDFSKSASNFNQANAEINNRIALLSQTLWELIPLDKKDEILRHNYGSVDAFSSTKSDSKKLAWDILLRFSANVNNYIVFPAAKTIAFQYCASILNIMLKIVETVKLTNENYNSFQEWLFDLSKKVGSKEAGIGEMIVKLLFAISFKYDSPVSNIKYIALEQSVINATPVCTCSSSANTLYTNQNKILKFISLTEQFKFLTQSNSLSIHRLTFDCLISWFKSVEWSINNYTYFDSNNLIESMCKQLEITTSTLNYLIMSVSSIDSSDLILKLMAHFYTLMDHLLKSDFVLKLNNRETLYMLKSLIETVYANFNSKKISTELKKIQEIRATVNYNNKESPPSINNDTLYFCIQKINSFEKGLAEFSKKNSLIVEMRFMGKYKTLVSSIKFNFSEESDSSAGVV